MKRSTLIVAVAATGVGIAIAVRDVMATGDDADMLTLILLFVASALFGSVQPERPWRWALLLGLWLPVAHLAAKAFGFNDHFHPDTYPARFALLPVALLVTLLGGYGGAFARNALQSSSMPRT